jgi:hypothetical protein
VAPESASATSPAVLASEHGAETTWITREKVLEDALRAAEAERDFLREVVRALVERRGPVRIG